MIVQIIKWLENNYGHLPGGGLVDYITFRAGLAILLSLIISIVFGGYIISFLQRKQVGETVRELGLEGQKKKEGTPTMGGLIIVGSILIPVLLIADLSNIYLIIMIIAAAVAGCVHSKLPGMNLLPTSLGACSHCWVGS